MKRCLFDHIPKTAGQAVNRLLKEALGERRVTDPLIGVHEELISRYGHYDIITAHVTFKPGSTLDSAYTYFTILREPVDRALSCLYYLSCNVPETSLTRGLIEAARLFLSSEGDSLSAVLDGYLRNPYLTHFMQLAGATCRDASNCTEIGPAFRVLSEYGLIGMYDSLQPFIDELCDELCVPRRLLSIVNSTTTRRKADEIPKRLLARLQQLTSADSEFFEAANRLVAQRRNTSRGSSDATGQNSQHSLAGTGPNFTKEETSRWNTSVPENAVDIVFSAVRHLGDSPVLTSGAWAKFEFHADLRLDVKKLLVGVQIFEDSGRWIFGTNSDLLKHNFSKVPPCLVVIRFNIRMSLAPGNYVAGLALHDSESINGMKLLGWWDRLLDFKIQEIEPLDFGGIVRLDSELHLNTSAGAGRMA